MTRQDYAFQSAWGGGAAPTGWRLWCRDLGKLDMKIISHARQASLRPWRTSLPNEARATWIFLSLDLWVRHPHWSLAHGGIFHHFTDRPCQAAGSDGNAIRRRGSPDMRWNILEDHRHTKLPVLDSTNSIPPSQSKILPACFQSERATVRHSTSIHCIGVLLV